MEHVICNLCGSASASKFIIDLPDFLLQREDHSATFVKCANCGLVYQNPRPTFSEMGAYYPPEYESYAPEPDPEHASWLLRKAIRYGIAKRCRYITRHKHSGRLLDIGCAAGIFLQGIRDLGNWEPYGVEVNEQVARNAQEHGLAISPGTLEQAGFEAGYFDAVTLWDVLEHLHDPAGSLREIHRILKLDGLVVIRVPNENSWDSRLFGRFWAGLDAPRHLFVYTVETLEELLEKAGFKVVGKDSASGGYPAFLLSLRFWMTNKKPYPRYGRALLSILYHPIMRVITVPVFYLRGLALRGPQIVVTAVRKEGSV